MRLAHKEQYFVFNIRFYVTIFIGVVAAVDKVTQRMAIDKWFTLGPSFSFSQVNINAYAFVLTLFHIFRRFLLLLLSHILSRLALTVSFYLASMLPSSSSCSSSSCFSFFFYLQLCCRCQDIVVISQ